MALAESSAGARGKPIRPPQRARSWSQACAAETDRAIALARAIATEASRAFPETFPDPSGLIAGLTRRVTTRDRATPDGRAVFGAIEHDDIGACTPDQVRRIVEGLRSWVGRVFAEHHRTPSTFTIPREAAARASRRSPAPTPAPSPRSGEGAERSEAGGGFSSSPDSRSTLHDSRFSDPSLPPF
jgi:hypothetical protein